MRAASFRPFLQRDRHGCEVAKYIYIMIIIILIVMTGRR